MDRLDRAQGCLLGLAIGDALGYPHEFRTVEQVRREIGPAGITDFEALQDPRFSRPFFVGRAHPPGTYTDDTQMTIALAEGLLDAAGAPLDDVMAAIGRRFVAWATSDDNDRSPGGTCLTGCDNLARGVPWRDAGVPDSKGCGSAMRVAPLGLWLDDLDDVAEWARASSLLTHGHPAALEGAAACALMVALALRDASPETMFDEVAARCGGRSKDFDDVWGRLPALRSAPPEVALSLHGLGESWVAEEAAASALYCYWRFPDDYRAAVLCGANTDGDSDSIACIAGSILGARHGLAAIPATWVERIENRDGLLDLASRIAVQRPSIHP